MSGSVDINVFVDDLRRDLRDEKLSMLDAEFLVAVEAGVPTREQIGAWARVFYAVTRNGRLGLGNFYANSPDDPVLRRELAENIYEEETGRISGVNKCHMDVFLDFLAAFGIGPEEAGRLTAPVGQEPPQGRAIPVGDFYVELATYGLSVETPNAEYCTRIFRALRDHYGFSERELTWFSMHAALDADHGAEFQRHVARAADAPDGLQRVRAQTRAMSAAVKHVWDGFGVWRGAA